MMSILLTGFALGMSFAVVLGLLVMAVLSQRGQDSSELIDDPFGVGAFRVGRCETCGREYNAGPVGRHGRTDQCYLCSQEAGGALHK